MNFLKLSRFVALLGLVVFSSCEDKIELTAPYKEIPAIYAVLNPDDALHMIRINKSFLGVGDANQMAQIADSINYPAGELQVTLRHTDGSIISFRDSLIKTAEGAFNNNQRVYCSNEKLKTSGTYTLLVKNIRTGNEFVSVADALEPLGLKSPSPNASYPPFTPQYYPVNPPTQAASDYVDYSIQEGRYPYTIRYFPSKAKIYQLLMRLHYYDVLGDGNYNYTWVDYPFGNQYLKDLPKGSSQLYVEFRGSDLFSAVGVSMSKVPTNSLLKGRKMYKIEFLLYSSTQEYIDYLEYSKPSFSISQVKPIYSNFRDKAAMGLFTFRCSASVEKEMATSFISEFARNKYTCKYQFYNAANSLVSCPN